MFDYSPMTSVPKRQRAESAQIESLEVLNQMQENIEQIQKRLDNADKQAYIDRKWSIINTVMATVAAVCAIINFFI